MDLHVQLRGRGNLARRIYRQIRAAILDGCLRRGDRLPPTRELARRLEVSRNTVSLAYEWLVAEGLITGRQGAGSFVESDPLRRARRRKVARLRYRSFWGSVVAPAPPRPSPQYDFRVGTPDATLFPFDTWRRLLARQVRASYLNGEYGEPAGHPRLRAAIARQVAVSRGVEAEAEDVIVTNGAQGAFDLASRLLIEPGASVAVEEPGYPPVRHLFESYGARVVPVAVDAEGLDVGALPRDARLVYVTPSHQFPLGMPMTHRRRVALLDWAERENAVVIEDDYDSEFRFGGRPLETLSAIDENGRVIYVGSFSKSLLPALRLGFLVAPPSLRGALRTASYVVSGHVQWPAQGALASLIENGLLARHVRRARRAYAARHERILQCLESDFAPWMVPVPSVTGMHLAARIHTGSLRLERAVAERARSKSVAIGRLSTYFASSAPQPGVLLGYGAISESGIQGGLKRLRECFTAAQRRS